MATATLPTASDSVRASTMEPSPVMLPPDDVLYEVVNGQIVELPPMGVYETDIANLLAYALNQHARKDRTRSRFHRDPLPDRPRSQPEAAPDLAFVSRSRWPFGKRVPDAEAWDMVPDLAVEVVSDSNKANEIIVKVNDYFRTGSRVVWVVYPWCARCMSTIRPRTSASSPSRMTSTAAR